MKRYAIIFVGIVALLASACGPQVQSQPKELFTIDGVKVEFSPPPAEWKRTLQRVGEEGKDLGRPADTIISVRFDHPGGTGHLAVAHLEQNRKIAKPEVRDEDGKVTQKLVFGDYIKIEDDQDTLNKIAEQVIKRDGEILEQKYVDVEGEKAFQMEYRFGTGESVEHGIQLHFTKNKRHFTVALNVPDKEFKAARPHFDNLVQSFRLK